MPAWRDIADGLPYRDFITVGLLLRRMTLLRGRQSRASPNGMPPDNWIYIQEPDVRLGRLQVFNNWSLAMVADPDTIWLGLEYFCRQRRRFMVVAGRAASLILPARELEAIGMIDRTRCARRDRRAGAGRAYRRISVFTGNSTGLRAYLDGFANLFPVGRNGMHRYNNQDHSMLTASSAVGSIINGGLDKSEIWRINTEEEYHEDARVPDERRASA